MGLKKITKLAVAVLSVITFVLLFLPLVKVTRADESVVTLTGTNLFFKNQVFPDTGSEVSQQLGGCFAGFIIVAASGLLLAVTALVSWFDSHRALNIAVNVLCTIAALVGMILIWTIASKTGKNITSDDAAFTVGGVFAGVLASLALLGNFISLAFEVTDVK